MKVLRKVLCIVISIGASSCTSVPPYDLTVNGPPSAPAGPKVASLLANLKCELYAAVHDTEVIPRYYDDPSLITHYDEKNSDIPGWRPRSSNPDRWFTLKNLSQEIEYVGEAQFQLDVTSTPGISPSVNFITPHTASTNLTLSVNGSLSEAAHRNLQIYSSIDFERLIESPPHKGVRNTESPVALFAPTRDDPDGVGGPAAPCNGRTELGGFLGLKENLTYHAITGDMNDLSVWPKTGEAIKIPSTDFFAKWGVDAIIIQVDFTITSGVNGGPNWTLTHFKGPAGSPGLVSFTRAVKDTLTLTIIPICIRQKYKALNDKPPYIYDPKLIEGTPRWGNFLPPCSTGRDQKAQALSTARTYNILKTNSINGIVVPP